MVDCWQLGLGFSPLGLQEAKCVYDDGYVFYATSDSLIPLRDKENASAEDATMKHCDCSSCDCYGCWFLGQGTCGCQRCDTCGGDFDFTLRCTDEETNKHACPACNIENASAEEVTK